MGRGIDNLYAQGEATVILADYNVETLNSAVEGINADGGDAVGIETNVAIREQVKKMAQIAVDTFHTLNILLNTAVIMDNFEPVGD